jgi:cysteine desulfurase
MIYADYNGSAPLCPEVIAYLQERLSSQDYANPNASHFLGQKVLMGMENARSLIAKHVGALPKQIVLNSGSTEGISQVFFSLLHCRNISRTKNVVLISSIEHSAVLKCGEFYATDQGYEVHLIPAQINGETDLGAFNKLAEQHQGKIAMVAVMAANNETAVVQPYMEIGKVCQKEGIPFVCDTTQYIGKTEFNFNETPIDFAFLSGHKIGALTGAGAIIAKDTSKLKPFIIGGGQEKNLRGGTQNYLGFETIGVAIKAFQHKKEKLPQLEEERSQFEKRIKESYPEVIIMGEEATRLPGTTFISHPSLLGKDIQREFEENDIYVTTTSACSDNTGAPSKVLAAMGIEDHVAKGAVRISVSLCSPKDHYGLIFDALKNAYDKLL